VNQAILRDTGLALFGTSLGYLTYRAAADRDNFIHLLLRRYIRDIDKQFQTLQLKPEGARIASIQGMVFLVVCGVAMLWGPTWWQPIALLLSALMPGVVLTRARRARRARIDGSVPTFSVSLANALKTTPSIGKALLRVQTVVSGPLADELALTLRELRLGTTVDQALLNLSARVQSETLDVALSAVLIGRQVGGPIPTILETTAESLREMERLQGVLRAKTAEGKGQVWIMAFSPAVIVIAFDTLQPGYFEPLFAHVAGLIIIATVSFSWVGSIVLARKILAVEL
jgi:tight adherence protein B